MKRIEGNKMISEFMGFPYYVDDCYKSFRNYSEDPDEPGYSTKHLGRVVCASSPDIYESEERIFLRNMDYMAVNTWYDSSIVLLISVVEKIEKMGYTSTIISSVNKHFCSFTDDIGNIISETDFHKTKIGAIFQAIIYFIKTTNYKLK